MTIKKHGGIFGRNPEFSNISNVGSAALKNLTTTDSALNISSSAADGSVTINASGNVGVGGSGTNTVTNGLAVNNATAGNYPGYEIQTADTTRFYINASDAASYIVSIGTSPMVFFTNGGEAARFNSSKNLAFPSGQGIDFSATSGTGTSELFDDYEEGTWTVGIEDASGNASATTATGYYTKIGNTVRVHFSFITNIDTTGLTSGDIFRITGLPFTVANGVHQGNFYANQLTNNASRVVPFPNAMSGTAYMQVINVGDNVNASYIPVSAINSGTTDFAALVLIYETAS